MSKNNDYNPSCSIIDKVAAKLKNLESNGLSLQGEPDCTSTSSGGGAVAQSVERAIPDKEVVNSIPAVAARSLLVGSVSVLDDRLRQKSWSPSSVSCVAARKIVRRSVLGPVRDIA